MGIRSEERAVRLTRVLVALPPARLSFLCIIVFGLAFGLLVAVLQGKTGPLELAEGMGSGLFLIALPALLSVITTALVKRELTLNRMAALAFAGSIVYALFYLAYLLLAPYNLPLVGDGRNLVYVAFGLVFCVWLVIAQLVFGLRWMSFLFALIQLFYNAVFLLANKMITMGTDPYALLVRVYFSSLAFLAATYAVFVLLNAPMRRAFGVSGTEAIRLFLAQWLHGSKEIEEVFESVGERARTLLSVVAFRSGKRLRAVFVIPYIHFGPFGNLGGSEFPEILGRRLWRLVRAPVFVFHGTATHDFNPVASKAVDGLIAVAREALAGLRFAKARGLFSVGRAGGSRALVVRLNKDALIFLTRAPRTTEDIDFGLGLALRNHARALGVREAVVIDSHNAETGEIFRIDGGNPIGFEFMKAIEDALKSRGLAPLKAGFAARDFPEIGKRGGIGGNGLRVAAFSFGKRTFCLLLFDANGVTPAFRRELLDLARKNGVEAEVATTDTHSVNVVSGVLNPLGKSGRGTILAKTEEALREALASMQVVEVGVATREIEMDVIGPRSASELMGTLNAMIAMLRILLPLIILATVLFVLWGVTRL
ncbi:MAG: DUF2070 family protein [Candidatus Micrarchaeia archaeon]